MSGALQELTEHGLIRKVGKVAYGGQTYVAEPEIGKVIRNVLRNRELNLITTTEAAIEAVLSNSKNDLAQAGLDQERLRQLQNLTQTHKSFLRAFVSRGYSSMQDWLNFVSQIGKFLIKTPR